MAKPLHLQGVGTKKNLKQENKLILAVQSTVQMERVGHQPNLMKQIKVMQLLPTLHLLLTRVGKPNFLCKQWMATFKENKWFT